MQFVSLGSWNIPLYQRSVLITSFVQNRISASAQKTSRSPARHGWSRWSDEAKGRIPRVCAAGGGVGGGASARYLAAASILVAQGGTRRPSERPL
jgi:hypothetical protein